MVPSASEPWFLCRSNLALIWSSVAVSAGVDSGKLLVHSEKNCGSGLGAMPNRFWRAAIVRIVLEMARL